MVNVGKREDAMLDKIGLLTKNKHAVLWWMANYEKLGKLSPELAAHLRWELTKTEEDELEQHDKIKAALGRAHPSTASVSGGPNDGDSGVQRTGIHEDGEAP